MINTLKHSRIELPLFIRRDLGTSQSVCRDKNFSYHICYENIDGKQQNTPKSRDRQTMDHGP